MPSEFNDTPNGPVICAGVAYFHLLNGDPGFQVELCALIDELDKSLIAPFPTHDWQLAARQDPDSEPELGYWQQALNTGSVSARAAARRVLTLARGRATAGRRIREFTVRWHLPSGINALVAGEAALLDAWWSWRRTGRVFTPTLGAFEGYPALPAELVPLLPVELSAMTRPQTAARLAKATAAVIEARQRERNTELLLQWRAAQRASAQSFTAVSGEAFPGPGKWAEDRILVAAQDYFHHYYPDPSKAKSIGQLSIGRVGAAVPRGIQREIQYFRALLRPRETFDAA